MDDWYRVVSAEYVLPADAARRLYDFGFAVLPGPEVEGGPAVLSEAYDRAVSAADSRDVSVRSSTRVHDFVNRGPEFDGLYVHRLVLAACCQVIGRPFKLSAMLARTLEPGAPAQPLHVDVARGADGWPLVGFIIMVDAFDGKNGATRFVPGSHLLSRDPSEVMADAAGGDGGEVLACGAAGSVVIFNGSVWHGHSANRSDGRRRSVQGAFIPREARAAIHQASRSSRDTPAHRGPREVCPGD